MNREAVQSWLTDEGPYAAFWATSALAVVCLLGAAAGLLSWRWFFLAVAGIAASLLGVHRAMPRRRLKAALTPAVVSQVVAEMGAYVANRRQRYGRESDLPYRRAVIEAAFVEALRDTPDGAELDALTKFYMFLDDHLLNGQDADVLNRWNDFVTAHGTDAQLLGDEVALARAVLDAGAERAVALRHSLSKKADERLRTIQIIRRA